MRVCQFRHFGTGETGAKTPGWAASPSLTNLPTPVKPLHAPGGRGILSQNDDPLMTSASSPRPIPEEQAKEIRRLAHDLSNALEIVLQTSFLLGTVPLDEDAQKWRSMLDNGVQQAATINKTLREYIRANS